MWSLARKLLLHDRPRFAVAIAGVSVAVMLVLVQVGLYLGFMNTASALIDRSTADIWVAKENNDSFEFALPFDDRTFYKVSSIRGVERAERMLINFGHIKLADGADLGALIVGIEPQRSRPMLLPWNVAEGDVRRLVEFGTIVLDHSEYDKTGIRRVGHKTEIAGVRAEVVAMTDGIRSFTTWPILFTDIRTARSYLPRLGGEPVTYVLVRVAASSSVDAVKARIDALPHVAAYTRAEMSERTRSYWSNRTGIGAGFFTTAVLGVIVGFVVVGQILYSGTLQHLREYGTLKAMGARNAAVIRLILAQAMISAGAGFAVGVPLAMGARALMSSANLTVALSGELFAITLVVTAVMCALAALLSIVKVLRLDPASVFKS